VGPGTRWWLWRRAAARETLDPSELDQPVGVVCGNAIRLPIRDGSLDAIFMSFTLELFGSTDLCQVLGECKRFLTQKGRIAIASVSSEGSHGFAYEAYEWAHRQFPTLVDCRPIALAQELQSAGFQVREQVMALMWVPVEVVVADVQARC